MLLGNATPLDGRVSAAIAERWDVPATAITLQWPRALPDSLGRTAVVTQVAGRGADGWFVVMLRIGARHEALRVRAGTLQPVAVAARSLAAGRTLASGDVRTAAALHWGPPQAAPRVPQPGWTIRLSLAPGDTLKPLAAVAPIAVSAGQPVRLVWSRGAVEIALDARALHDARIGEPVRLDVAGHRKRLVATVSGPGLARLDDAPTHSRIEE